MQKIFEVVTPEPSQQNEQFVRPFHFPTEIKDDEDRPDAYTALIQRLKEQKIEESPSKIFEVQRP